MPTRTAIDKMQIQVIDHDGVEKILDSFNRRRFMRELTVLQRQNAKYMLRKFKLAFRKQKDPTTGKC